MFIAWRPLATGDDADDGVKRMVGDLTIVSHPRSGAAATDTWLQEPVPLWFHSAVRSHQCTLGELSESRLVCFKCVHSSFSKLVTLDAAFACLSSFLCFSTLFSFKH